MGLLASSRLRLREHGLEWLLELAIPVSEAEEILVYLDALESGREFRRPDRLAAESSPWITLLDESDARRFTRVHEGRATLHPTSALICGWSIQAADRPPLERRFEELTLAIAGQAVRVRLGDDGTPAFDGLYLSDEVALVMLRAIDFGGCALEMPGRGWDEIYDGHAIYRIVDGPWRDVEITVFKDAGSWDYVDSIRMPDGRSDRIDSDAVLDWEPTDPSPWEDAPRSARPSQWFGG